VTGGQRIGQLVVVAWLLHVPLARDVPAQLERGTGHRCRTSESRCTPRSPVVVRPSDRGPAAWISPQRCGRSGVRDPLIEDGCGTFKEDDHFMKGASGQSREPREKQPENSSGEGKERAFDPLFSVKVRARDFTEDAPNAAAATIGMNVTITITRKYCMKATRRSSARNPSLIATIPDAPPGKHPERGRCRIQVATRASPLPSNTLRSHCSSSRGTSAAGGRGTGSTSGPSAGGSATDPSSFRSIA
jgi:hypothetical protein